MSEITKGCILQTNDENEREEIEKVIEVVEKQYFKDIQNKAPVENIRFNEIILYALKEKLERENPRPLTNYERIKNMNIEEMAEFLDDMQNDALFLEGTINDLAYTTEWLKYLESEVSENA